MSKSVCILYGFSEGPKIGAKFTSALQKAGFNVVQNAKEADIIFAHSGGSCLIPLEHKAQKIIIVGLPYWPGRSILGGIFRKFFMDMSRNTSTHNFKSFAQKTFWNMCYVFRIDLITRMAIGRINGTLWHIQTPTIVVRNEHDTFCIKDTSKLPFDHPPKVIHMPGQHDDCWYNPTPYINQMI